MYNRNPILLSDLFKVLEYSNKKLQPQFIPTKVLVDVCRLHNNVLMCLLNEVENNKFNIGLLEKVNINEPSTCEE